jgi:hypothetical protein
VRLLLALLVLPGLGVASDGELNAGNESFWKGDFVGAVERYRRVTESAPGSADAWFNLGTAEASARHIGPAVHAFEQALLLRPGDPDALYNLGQTRAAAIEQGVQADEGARVILPGDDDLGTGLLTAVAPTTLGVAFAVAWALLFVLVALWRRVERSGLRTALSFAAVLTSLVALGSGGLLAGRVLVVDATDYGVVIAQQAAVRAGPGDQYRTSARLLGGVKVQLRNTDQGWRQVTLPDGSEGWLRTKALAPLRRP